jgi:hypothetical protein
MFNIYGQTVNHTSIQKNQRYLLYFIKYSAHFFIDNDDEILHAHYTLKAPFTNLIHKQSIHVKL